MSENKKWNQIEKLINEGKPGEALDLIERLIPETQNPERLINAKAVALTMMGKYKEAEAELEPVFMIQNSPENLDKLYNLIEIYKQNGKPIHSESIKYSYAFSADDDESREYINDLKARTRAKENTILEQGGTVQDYIELVNLYSVQCFVIEAVYLLTAMNIKHETIESIEGWKAFFDCAQDKNSVYIAVESENHSMREVFLNALMKLSENVYYIKAPIEMETDGINFQEEDLILLTINNKTEHENLTILTPMLLTDKNTGNKLDTTGRLISYIEKQHKDKKCMMFISNTKFSSLDFASNVATIYINRNFNDQHHYNFDDMCIYRIGEYINMYSELYRFDIKKALQSPPEVKISIVIPTRNCPETLRYTLLSCLDQSYEDYEIVLSDNGDPGDEQICVLAEEMNAKCIKEGKKPKIKYYHTPGPLSLPKSFEFAYLHTRGEFIFGLGSDDAVMPDALKVLAKIIDENPNDDVILWNRNTYFWPNSSPGQKNQLIYSIRGASGEYETVRLSNIQFLNLVLTMQIGIYGMPMCYINSGMRKQYIKKIIDKTGTFIGGVGQDIYMGILNLYLNKEVVFAICPITVAALSGKSIGGMNLFGIRSQEDRKRQTIEWQKTLITTEPETKSQKLIPMTNWDMTVFYNQLLRIRDISIGRIYGDENVPFKELFEQALINLSPLDLNNPWHINNMLEAAKLHGDTFYKNFKLLADEYMKTRTKRKLEYEKILEIGAKIYTENETPDNGGNVILDASKYGITDVYAAAKFIESQIKTKTE